MADSKNGIYQIPSDARYIANSRSSRISVPKKVSYEGSGTIANPKLIQFTSPVIKAETEITGYIVTHLNISMTPDPELANKDAEKDIDVFLTLRRISPSGKEIFYTGTAGNSVPLKKGWLRVSLHKITSDHPKNRPYLPHREYLSTDVQQLSDTIYSIDVEILPPNVIIERGGKLVFEVSSGDTQGSRIFSHESEADRPRERFAGINSVCFGERWKNYVVLPVIPPKWYSREC